MEAAGNPPSAWRITASCARPFGAVKPLDAPSWLTAEPRSTASTRSPAASASDRRLSTSAPQPSLRTKPSAAASKVLQRPSGASARVRETAMELSGDRIRLTPPAMARSHSPLRRFWLAVWIAVSDDEQAVSIAMLGPCTPSP